MFVVWLWIKEAFIGLFRNMRWNMTAIFLSTVCLFLFAASFVVGMNANYFAKLLDEKIEVKIYLLETVTDYEKIEADIKKLDNVKTVKFISKEEALRDMKKDLGEDGDMLDALDKNPLAASFVVKLHDPSKLQMFVSQVEKMNVSEYTSYGKGFVEKILLSAKAISKGGYILTLFGIVFTVFVVFTAIQNNIARRKEEIRIKQLIGAGPLTVRVPFVLEAILLTGISSGIVYGVFYYGLPKTMTSIMGSIKEAIPNFRFLDPYEMVDELFVPLFVLSLLIGFVGSTLSTYRNIKKSG